MFLDCSAGKWLVCVLLTCVEELLNHEFMIRLQTLFQSIQLAQIQMVTNIFNSMIRRTTFSTTIRDASWSYFLTVFLLHLVSKNIFKIGGFWYVFQTLLKRMLSYWYFHLLEQKIMEFIISLEYYIPHLLCFQTFNCSNFSKLRSMTISRYAKYKRQKNKKFGQIFLSIYFMFVAKNVKN